MRRFQSTSIPNDARGASVAIGNFDGVHLGHQAVLDVTRSIANRHSAPLGVLTFEPHPRSYFSKKSGQDFPPFRLMNADARANRLEKLGVDFVFEIPFDDQFSRLSDIEFSRDVITQGLGLSHVVVGSDFCFGKGRQGNASSLTKHGSDFGFGVTIADLLNHGEKTISSTNIRNALTDGDLQTAAAMLGHWHRIVGPVEHGEKRGRELGFPTANMSIDGLHLPKFGVYAVTVDVLTGPDAGTYMGAASIGVRPMFGENHPNCETFLFDFSGDLYGQTLSVGLVEFLRGEEKFDGLDALITQMNADCARARQILEQI
ncbi:MAG: bifunctional riboflavin kinase/FAD synthetase [Planktomarina sp.]